MAARRRVRSAHRRSKQQDSGIGGLLVLLGFAGLWAWQHAPWLLILLALAAVSTIAILIARKRRRQQEFELADIGAIDAMDGRQFEERLAAHFRQQGYRFDLTPYQGDFGADLILERDGVRTAVQAKRWRKNVGVGAVQEIVSAKGYYRCQRALVVTNSTFTQAATSLARANDVALWDRQVLITELARRDATPLPIDNRQLQW